MILADDVLISQGEVVLSLVLIDGGHLYLGLRPVGIVFGVL